MKLCSPKIKAKTHLLICYWIKEPRRLLISKMMKVFNANQKFTREIFKQISLMNKLSI